MFVRRLLLLYQLLDTLAHRCSLCFYPTAKEGNAFGVHVGLFCMYVSSGWTDFVKIIVVSIDRESDVGYVKKSTLK